LLDAEIRGGTFGGMTPQYAPDYLLRTGVIYRWQQRLKLAFLGTFVADHFATDDENPSRLVPAYMTWDLTLEWAVIPDRLRLLAGINNIFDEDYYARIRSDGIDPAYGRNFYAGASLEF
jgi:Fe(3+) dicitrate transport protein